MYIIRNNYTKLKFCEEIKNEMVFVFNAIKNVPPDGSYRWGETHEIIFLI